MFPMKRPRDSWQGAGEQGAKKGEDLNLMLSLCTEVTGFSPSQVLALQPLSLQNGTVSIPDSKSERLPWSQCKLFQFCAAAAKLRRWPTV